MMIKLTRSRIKKYALTVFISCIIIFIEGRDHKQIRREKQVGGKGEGVSKKDIISEHKHQNYEIAHNMRGSKDTMSQAQEKMSQAQEKHNSIEGNMEEMISSVQSLNIPFSIQNVTVDVTIDNALSVPGTFTPPELLSRICNPSEYMARPLPDVGSILSVKANQGHESPLLDMNKKEIQNGKEKILVGVYYYPWYGNNFHGKKYLREKLLPRQIPILGEYNDNDCEVIGQHLLWTQSANINLWVTSWWGPGSIEDVTISEHILTNPLLGSTNFAIHYETIGRTEFNRTSKTFSTLQNIAPDVSYLAKKYFDHPNYFRIQNRPVIVLYLARRLAKDGILSNVTEIMRSTAMQTGHELYILGDYSFGRVHDHKLQGLNYLDGITNFDVYGSTRAKQYIGWEKLITFFSEELKWKSAATNRSIHFIPSASPGYNDKGVREGNEPLSRKLTPDDAFGSFFRAQLSNAIKNVDKETGNLILINSFNEWHEDTQIEPIMSASPTQYHSGVLESLSSTKKSIIDYTEGIYYEGYGTRYLDMLRDITVSGPC